MEGSESEAIFDSLNLNPQLYVNEVLNTVDDVVGDAFDFFYQEALSKLSSEGTERSQDLRKGVDRIHNVIQSVLEKRLAIWEKYCLHHSFAVPQGFVMPKSDESTEDGSVCRDAPFEPDVDAQLDSLRKKLTTVGKESEMLNQELQALERRSTSNAGYVKEALQSFEQNSLHELFQEIVTTASELRMKMGKLNTGMIEETEQMKTERIYNRKADLSVMDHAKGLSDVRLEDLQELLAIMKNN